MRISDWSSDVCSSDLFPALANGAIDWQRRDVLRAFGASLALAGLAGCEANPDDRALPYVESPEDLLPGVPRLYATAVPFAGIAQPVLGVTSSGRPIKLEGNPDHSARLGATRPEARREGKEGVSTGRFRGS